MEESIKHNSAEGKEKFHVSARHLREFLQVKFPYTIWMKTRIEQYNFTEGEDYIVFSEKRKNPDGTNRGGRPTIDYYLTRDMAKAFRIRD